MESATGRPSEPDESLGGRPAGAAPAGWRRRVVRIAGEVALRLGWLLLVAGLFWLLAFGVYVDVAVLALLIWLAVRTKKAKLVTLLAGSFLAFGLLELGVRIEGTTGEGNRDFRPHEKLYVLASRRPNLDPPVPRYQSNANILFSMPHGDLLAVDPWLPRSIAEPRTVRFITDSWGFRNDRPYSGEAYLLAGDSLVVGNGTEQSAILPNVLRNEQHLRTYSVAHPADPDGYFDNLGWAFNALKPPPTTRALVFLFECNDFISRGQRPVRLAPTPDAYEMYKLGKLWTHANWLRTPGFVFNVTRHHQRALFNRGTEIVEVHPIGEHEMGFSGSCVDASYAEPMHLFMARLIPESVVKRIAAVFLIPSKYRVYAPFLQIGRRKPPNPPPALRGLHAAFDPLRIPVFDLTPALQAEAWRLLPQGQYVYWRDDSHWNGAGIRVAARAIAEAVRGLSARPLPNPPPPSSLPPGPRPPASAAPPSSAVPSSGPPRPRRRTARRKRPVDATQGGAATPATKGEPTT